MQRLIFLLSLLGILAVEIRPVFSQQEPGAVGTPLPATQIPSDNVENIPDVVLRLVEERMIHCKSSGIVMSSEVKEGKQVAAGELLVKLDTSKAELHVQRLEAEQEVTARQASSQVELHFGQKSIDVAEADLNRALESNQEFPGLYPEPEVNRLKLLFERAKAEYEKNAFQLELLALQVAAKTIDIQIAKVDLADRMIHSPIDGMIVQVLRRPGEWVEPGEPVAKIVRMDQLRVEVDVPVHYSPQQLQSVEAWFIADSEYGGQEPAAAKVSFVNPEVNPVSRTSRVWFDVENSQSALRPGIKGRLQLKFPPNTTRLP